MVDLFFMFNKRADMEKTKKANTVSRFIIAVGCKLQSHICKQHYQNSGVYFGAGNWYFNRIIAS
jgi:hypothetical protein